MWCVFELSHHVVLALRAQRSCQNEARFGYLDPSRGPWLVDAGTLADGLCDPIFLRGFVDAGDWPCDVASGALCYDSDNCSTAVHGHSSDRSRKAPRSRQLGKTLDER